MVLLYHLLVLTYYKVDSAFKDCTDFFTCLHLHITKYHTYISKIGTLVYIIFCNLVSIYNDDIYYNKR